MGNAIEIKNVSKAFENQQILENVSMKIAQGQCCLLLGKNGSGKTTLLRCLLDLLQPDSGEVIISELKYVSEAIQIKELMGIVSEDNPLVVEFRAYTYLELVGLLHKIPSELLKSRINTAFDYFFENKADINKQIMNFSTGMMKKLSICAAILHKPKILILDEPFSGLDVYSLNIFTLFLKTYLAEGNTILLTSHSFDNLNDIITHVAVLDNKSIIFHDTIDVFTDFGEKQIDKSLLSILQNKNGVNYKKLELL